MAAPKGNEFWKLRSKHGRDTLFADAKLLWEAACEYFQWCDNNPLIEIDYRGKDATEVKLPRMRPYTLQGLCLYLDCNTAYFRNFKNQDRKREEEFSSIITRIEETIYTQKFDGAAAGFFNANIISRDLGLSDKKELDHTTKGEKINNHAIDYSKLSDGALREIATATGNDRSDQG